MINTQVAILGAGPAGLLLGRMLQANGIDAVILEQRSKEYALARVRAGVLEQGTVDTLRKYGVNERLDREGIPHKDVKLCWDGVRHAIPMQDESGRQMTTYGQQKIVEDLIALREADDLPLYWESTVEAVEGLQDAPIVHYTQNGVKKTLKCEYVAGCDGFWGVARKHIPEYEKHSFLKEFPFSWFGILADAPLNVETQGFCHNTRGLALTSSRGATVSRHYLQVDPDFQIESMTDEQIWDELDLRLADQYGNTLTRGPITEKSVARLRGFVCERMQHGRLAIAGDAAHIVPPSGAKGLNLAVGDVRILCESLVRALKNGDEELYSQYTELALKRIWPTVHFSCLMSEAFHMFPGQTDFDTRRQYQTLEYWTHTEQGQQYLRSSMLGQPYPV
jgi:p-hydroxybenzoate 3-monooxygenase